MIHRRLMSLRTLKTKELPLKTLDTFIRKREKKYEAKIQKR